MSAKQRGEAAISEATVLQKTGKSWREWYEILDAWGAVEKGHKLTARYLADEWSVSPWWSQTITVRYEQERGVRAPGQRSGGKFTVSFQRTALASTDQAFQAFIEPAALSSWFASATQADARPGGKYSSAEGNQGEFLILERPSRLRYSWDHPRRSPGTMVDVTFETRPDNRVTVRLEHSGIEDEAGYLELKKFWTKAMNSLKSYLEREGIP